jgi:hypothetical protein
LRAERDKLAREKERALEEERQRQKVSEKRKVPAADNDHEPPEHAVLRVENAGDATVNGYYAISTASGSHDHYTLEKIGDKSKSIEFRDTPILPKYRELYASASDGFHPISELPQIRGWNIARDQYIHRADSKEGPMPTSGWEVLCGASPAPTITKVKKQDPKGKWIDPLWRAPAPAPVTRRGGGGDCPLGSRECKCDKREPGSEGITREQRTGATMPGVGRRGGVSLCKCKFCGEALPLYSEYKSAYGRGKTCKKGGSGTDNLCAK